MIGLSVGSCGGLLAYIGVTNNNKNLQMGKKKKIGKWARVLVAPTSLSFFPGTPTPASSPPLAHVDAQRVHDKMETVLLQLRHVTRERDELRKRLALSSPGSTFDDCRYVAAVKLKTVMSRAFLS